MQASKMIMFSLVIVLIGSAEGRIRRFCPFNDADTPARLRAKQNLAAAREQLARAKQQQELNKAAQDKKVQQESVKRSHDDEAAQQSQEDVDLVAIILALREEAE